MKSSQIVATVAGAAAIAFMGNVYPEQKFDFGKREYDSKCAVCHGKQADGNGPYAGILDKRIPALSTLSKNNGGVFPTQRIMEIIDGRQVVKAHGPRDMPIWGSHYKAAANESYMDVPYDPESFVHTRILALTDYLSRVQKK